MVKTVGYRDVHIRMARKLYDIAMQEIESQGFRTLSEYINYLIRRDAVRNERT